MATRARSASAIAAVSVASVASATSTASASSLSARSGSPTSRWEMPRSRTAGARSRLPVGTSLQASSASLRSCSTPLRHIAALSSASQPSIEARAVWQRPRLPGRAAFGRVGPALGRGRMAEQRLEPSAQDRDRGVALEQLVVVEPVKPALQGGQPAAVVDRKGQTPSRPATCSVSPACMA